MTHQYVHCMFGLTSLANRSLSHGGDNMRPDQAIFAVLATLPNKKVRGKKRFQKLVHLWQSSGVEIDVNFRIRNYGPFSAEIEKSCALLSLFGDIEEKQVTFGYADFLMTEYSLPKDQFFPDVSINSVQKTVLMELDKFETVDLEVASTIIFFLRSGLSENDSIEKTRKIKPAKVNQVTLESTKIIMKTLKMN